MGWAIVALAYAFLAQLLRQAARCAGDVFLARFVLSYSGGSTTPAHQLPGI